MDERVLINEINRIRKRNYERKRDQKEKEAARSEARGDTRANAGNGAGAAANASFGTPKGVPVTPANPYERYELAILRYVVRYGNTPLYRKFEEQKRGEGGKVIHENVLVEVGPGVTEFIHFDLDRDKIQFTHPLYLQMFEEACEHMTDAQFESPRYFLSHPDPSVSKLASELISDRYHLSKIHAKILGEEEGDKDSRLLEENLLSSHVPRATTELKNAYVLQKIKEVTEKLKTSDPGNHLSLIGELKQLQEIKKVLSKELGERIVLRY